MSNAPSYDNREQSINEEKHHRRQIQCRHERTKKKLQRRNLFFAACVAVLLVLIIGIVLLCKSCTSIKPFTSSDSRIVGSYILSDRSCTYAFQEDGSGYLQLTGGSQYAFNYTLKGNTLRINFESTAITDSTYTVAFNDSRLTLMAGKGTIAPGKEYVLNRIQ